MWIFSHPFSMPGRVTVALVFAYIILGVEVCCCSCFGFFAIKEGENEYMTAARGIATACGCCFMVNVVWMLATAVGLQSANTETLAHYSVINGCSDEYTHVPVEDLTTRIN